MSYYHYVGAVYPSSASGPGGLQAHGVAAPLHSGYAASVPRLPGDTAVGGAPSPAHPGSSSHPVTPTGPQNWACDYCRSGSFRSFEEARAHESVCPYNQDRVVSNTSPPYYPQYHHNQQQQRYHTAAYNYTPQLLPDAPPMPSFTRGHVRQISSSRTTPPPLVPTPPLTSVSDPTASEFGKVQKEEGHSSTVLRLYTPGDQASLSDRQCYVRQNFVEVFTATKEDVQARHSKGAQKLHVGQVGIRCVFCLHMHPKERSERAVCYPSSISRIYQTVADMQRFHFEACTEIPEKMKRRYKSLKTTRPRGMGSPQKYWISSAYNLGLVDSGRSINYDASRAVVVQDDSEDSLSHSAMDEEEVEHDSPRQIPCSPNEVQQYDDHRMPGLPSAPTPTSSSCASSSDSHVSSPGMLAIQKAAEIQGRNLGQKEPKRPRHESYEERDNKSSPHLQPLTEASDHQGVAPMNHGNDEAFMLLSLKQGTPKNKMTSPHFDHTGRVGTVKGRRAIRDNHT